MVKTRGQIVFNVVRKRHRSPPTGHRSMASWSWSLLYHYLCHLQMCCIGGWLGYCHDDWPHQKHALALPDRSGRRLPAPLPWIQYRPLRLERRPYDIPTQRRQKHGHIITIIRADQDRNSLNIYQGLARERKWTSTPHIARDAIYSCGWEDTYQ